MSVWFINLKAGQKLYVKPHADRIQLFEVQRGQGSATVGLHTHPRVKKGDWIYVACHVRGEIQAGSGGLKLKSTDKIKSYF